MINEGQEGVIMSNSHTNLSNEPNSQLQRNLWLKISAFSILLVGSITFLADLSQILSFTLDFCKEKHNLPIMEDICPQEKQLQIENADRTNVVEAKKQLSETNSSEKNSSIKFKAARLTDSPNANLIRFKRSQSNSSPSIN